MPLMRLQKFLANAGVCSRRKGETYITAGRVRVNGTVVTELGTKVDPQADRVEVDGQTGRLGAGTGVFNPEQTRRVCDQLRAADR